MARPSATRITANEPVGTYGATDLPPGLTIDTSTGVISGTPTTDGITPITLSVTAADGNGTGTATLTLTVLGPMPLITSAPTARVVQDQQFSYQIQAKNGPLTDFDATGLPASLVVDPDTGIISGLADAD